MRRWPPPPLLWTLLALCAPAACSLVVAGELHDKTDEQAPASGGSAGTHYDASDADALNGHDASDDAREGDTRGDAPPDVPMCDGCAPGSCCDETCVDTTTDRRNCGGCGNACPAGRECKGGACDSGWVAMRTPPTTFVPRKNACAVWTGERMFIWGGQDGQEAPLGDGALYDPMSDAWTAVSTTNAPAPRGKPTCVATDFGVFVWGGTAGDILLGAGGLYLPDVNEWRTLATSNEPAPRLTPVALWTGTEVLIWGGERLDSNQEKSGARYHPGTEAWTPMNTGSCPSRSKALTAVWTGDRLLVFGGRDGGGANVGDKLFSYDPDSNSWAELSPDGDLAARSNGFATWLGGRMTIWGGLGAAQEPLQTGGSVGLTSPAWSPLPETGAPSPRARLPFVGGWVARADTRMLIFGGGDTTKVNQNGAIYAPQEAQKWTPIPSWQPSGEHHAGVGVWTGTEFIVWGGWDGSNPMDSGTRWML